MALLIVVDESGATVLDELGATVVIDDGLGSGDVITGRAEVAPLITGRADLGWPSRIEGRADVAAV